MGHKKVCINCRKAFNLYSINNQSKLSLTCPECGDSITVFSHRFRPPKQNDLKKWKVVEYLKDQGFLYQHIFGINPSGKTPYAKYPETLSEAEEFVVKYSDQAFKLTWDNEKQELVRIT